MVAVTKADVTIDEVATQIQKISQGVKKLLSESRLTDRAIILLICDASGCTQKEVKAVLSGLEELEGRFLKKDKK